MKDNFSHLYHSDLTFDKNSRHKKAEKILTIINEEISSKKLNTLHLLDVGCSEGLITSFLSNYFEKAIGVDVDRDAITKAKKIKKKNLSFIRISSESLPFKNNSFDIIVAHQIYEHIGDTRKMFEEIKRVLKPSGFCFLAAANRLVLIDAHYSTLPLVSLLPRSLANTYVRLAGKGSYYEPKLRTIFGIRKMIKDFSTTDYTIKIVKNPKTYHIENVVGTFISFIPEFIIKLLYPLIPNFIYILRKK